MILFVPIVLAVYTAGYVYGHGSFDGAGTILTLNVVLAISIVGVVVVKQVSTLMTMAIASYGFIIALAVVIVVGVGVVKAWSWVSSRLPIRLVALRNNQPPIVQANTQS